MIDFFILGNPRSGTTLLRLMLSAHSIVIVPPEAGFSVYLYEKYSKQAYSNEEFIYLLKNTSKIENWNLDFKRLLTSLTKEHINNITDAINMTYIFYANSIKGNRCLIGDKNNYFLHHINSLLQLSPNAKFIHIIRDGRDVACSYKGLMSRDIKSKYAPNLPVKIQDIAIEWKENNQKIITDLIGLPVYNVKLEDLIDHPEDELAGLCRFLGINYEQNMLDYHKKEYSNLFEPKDFDQWKLKNRKTLINDSYKYKTILTINEIKIFEKYAGEKLKLWGYKVDELSIKKI